MSKSGPAIFFCLLSKEVTYGSYRERGFSMDCQRHVLWAGDSRFATGYEVDTGGSQRPAARNDACAVCKSLAKPLRQETCRQIF